MALAGLVERTGGWARTRYKLYRPGRFGRCSLWRHAGPKAKCRKCSAMIPRRLFWLIFRPTTSPVERWGRAALVCPPGRYLLEIGLDKAW